MPRPGGLAGAGWQRGLGQDQGTGFIWRQSYEPPQTPPILAASTPGRQACPCISVPYVCIRATHPGMLQAQKYRVFSEQGTTTGWWHQRNRNFTIGSRHSNVWDGLTWRWRVATAQDTGHMTASLTWTTSSMVGCLHPPPPKVSPGVHQANHFCDKGPRDRRPWGLGFSQLLGHRAR